MLNQIRRIWTDNGLGDKDFSIEETKLKNALIELKQSADQMSSATATLLDLLSMAPEPSKDQK